MNANASMGPRSFERGNRAGFRIRFPRPTSFNGAALIRARKSGRSRWSWAGCYRFNGAALIRARKSLKEKTNREWTPMLQWGRAHSSAEIGKPSRPAPTTVSLQWGRAHSSAEIKFLTANGHEFSRFNGAALIRARKCEQPGRPQPGWRRFNGAALIRARKFLALVCQPFQAPSFNGAALIRARKYNESKPPKTSRPSLQWGRAHSSAEIPGS